MAENEEEPARGFRREGSGLEFDRVSFFSDAVYAIAMTLLVVELEVPEIPAGQTLAGAIAGKGWAIFAFFLGFVVLGRYWMAHHLFFGQLRSIDSRLIGVNLLYLAFVAFSPFPVGLISEYEEHPTAFLLFAGSMGAISLLEVVMLVLAARRGHFRMRMPPAVMRHAIIASSAPVAVILVSLPIAFASTTAALLSWLLMFPLSAWIDARAPAGLARYFRPDGA